MCMDKQHPHGYDQSEEYIMILYAKEQCPICTELLYNQYSKMIANYCRKKYKNLNSLTTEDLISQCYFYFLDAIRKFDIDTGNKFGTYLYHQLMQINRYVIQHDNKAIEFPPDYVQKLKKNEDTKLTSVSLNTVYNDKGESFEDIYEDPELLEELIAPEEMEAYRKAVLKLPEALQAQLALKLEGKTYKEIGEIMGCSEWEVNRSNAEMIRRLKFEIAKMELHYDRWGYRY